MLGHIGRQHRTSAAFGAPQRFESGESGCCVASMGGSLRIHENLDLCPRERTAQVGQTPARFEYDLFVLMYVVHQKNSVAQSGENLFRAGFIEFLSGTGGSPLQSLKHSRLISLSLQPPNKPGTSVG